MGHDSKDSGDNETLKLVKDLLGNISINQTVNVNSGSSDGHKDKKDDDDKGKKCECKGFTNGPTIFAEICPDCTIKESFVVIPGSFNSLTVNKPECFQVDNTEYLTTSGKGILDTLVGAYTLILADNPVMGGFAALTFFAVTDALVTLIVIAVAQDVDIEDCKNEKCKKSHKTLPGNLTALQNLANNTKPYAKKITLRPDGFLEEEDLGNLF